MGKNTEITKNLPKLPGDDPTWEDKVKGAKRDLALANPEIRSGAVAALYRSIRLEKETVQASLTVANLKLAAVELLLEEVYEADGIMSARMEDGTSVSTQPEPVVKVEDKEALWKWCMESGYERMMSLHNATLLTIVKERLQAGEPEPPGVKAYSRTKFVMRKG